MGNLEVWSLEHLFWSGKPEFAADHMHPDCLMILTGDEILAGEALRVFLGTRLTYGEEVLTHRTLVVPQPNVALIGYAVKVSRSWHPPFRALCTSTYHRQALKWQMLHHQQTARLEQA